MSVLVHKENHQKRNPWKAGSVIKFHLSNFSIWTYAVSQLTQIFTISQNKLQLKSPHLICQEARSGTPQIVLLFGKPIEPQTVCFSPSISIYDFCRENRPYLDALSNIISFTLSSPQFSMYLPSPWNIQNRFIFQVSDATYLIKWDSKDLLEFKHTLNVMV